MMTMPDGRKVEISGVYREIVRAQKLVLTWAGNYNNRETLITVTFRADGAGTVMTLHQTGFPDETQRDRHKTGWTGPEGSFAKLARVLTTDAPVLELKRTFDATPEHVFDAWMKRERWQAWIGPEGTNSDVTEFEPKVGGRYRVLMRMSDGREIGVTGVFKTIDRPRTFAMTWKWEQGEHDSLVTLSFRAVGNKTELTLRHDGLLTEENVDGHGKGWNSALNKLAAYLASGH